MFGPPCLECLCINLALALSNRIKFTVNKRSSDLCCAVFVIKITPYLMTKTEKSKHLKFGPKLSRSGQKNVIISLSHEWVEMITF